MSQQRDVLTLEYETKMRFNGLKLEPDFIATCSGNGRRVHRRKLLEAQDFAEHFGFSVGRKLSLTPT